MSFFTIRFEDAYTHFYSQPTTLVWVNNNMSGHYKRAISSAMMVGFGNAGGIVASNIFISGEEPAYPTGYGTTLGLLWVSSPRRIAFVVV